MNIKKELQDIVKLIRTRGTLAATSQDIKYVTVEIGVLFVTLAAYLTAAILMGLLVFKIIAVGGIEAVLAQLMAVTCVNSKTIPCDFNTLYAGIGLSLVIITAAAIAIIRETLKIERVPFEDAYDWEPCRAYNEDMTKILRDIQAMGIVENLKGWADWKGIHYTTMRRYIDQLEKDGYVTIHSNGKGTPIEIKAVKR